MDLFSVTTAPTPSPLADRMRPNDLDSFIGQEHLVGEGRLLRRAILADRLTSSLFYGPPGCGKTTLAHIIAHSTGAHFERLNAVQSGVADVRVVVGREPAHVEAHVAGLQRFERLEALGHRVVEPDAARRHAPFLV